MEAVEETVMAVATPSPERDGVGATLRARRIELNLTQGDVAHLVKLPTSRIEALEQERWEELPSGPYLRGFLRNIARALHLDAAVLIERVGASLVHAQTPENILVAPGTLRGTLPRRSGPADDRRGGRSLVFGACLFALIAALIAWSGTDSFDRTMAAAKSMGVASRGVAAATPASQPNDAAKSPVAVQEPAPPAAAGSVASASVPAAAAEPVPTAGVALTFHFNEDSWVEVRAADGKVLLQRLNTAGSEQEVDGNAPFSLVVGNAKGVALRFRGQPVDLGPYTRDQVARFTLS